MPAAPFPDNKLTVEEFLDWVEKDPDTVFEFEDGYRLPKSDVRFELCGGNVVAMAPERAIHAETKFRVALTLKSAIDAAGSACETWIDGVGVRIGDGWAFEPDAFIRCGDPVPPDAKDIDDPLVIVEVLSPASRGKDLGEKFEGYFLLPSLQHYLIVDPDRRRVIHHQRQADSDALLTRIVSAGSIRLDPPGIEVAIDDMLPPLLPCE